MHNGAFVRLQDAIRHHLDPAASVPGYLPAQLAPDLRGPTGPITPVLERIDPRLTTPVTLSDADLADLVGFVRDGLLDDAARPDRLRRLVPENLLSDRQSLRFQFP